MSDPIYIGVGTPQANPTVEIEFRRFCRAPVFPMITRLQSDAGASNDRLIDYLEHMAVALDSFDTLPLRLFAFACTGSSYLVDDAREDEIIRACESQFRVQIVTATQAIRRELEGRGARRIAILSPYPESLCDASIAYWNRLGFEVVASKRIDIGLDTRAIYDITDTDVADALDGFDTSGADVTLLSGTGMPTIEAIRNARAPMLSSNLCLATEALRRVQQWPPNEAADISQLLKPSQAGRLRPGTS